MIETLYDIWYKVKCAVFETYTDVKPVKLSLSYEKAFKPIRNALIYEACKLGSELKPCIKTQSGITNRSTVMNAALRFGRSIAKMFETNLRCYDSEDDDIDKRLRKEIQAIKNGENIVF